MSGLNNSDAGAVIGTYRETVHELYQFVSRRSGGSRELAEDVTQETYLRAVREWQSGRRPDVPLAWLQTVARNLLLNHYRRKTPELVEAARIEAIFDDNKTDGPDAAALVYWGLARLSRRRGELLEAFYLEGKKTAAIAREFGISERAVEGRLRRARQALRTQLERMIKQNGDMQ
jgi:RNA polymerase sigma-70 factor (ECF subfamily)